MESPVARPPRAGNGPGLLGTALGKGLELQGAQPCVPSSHGLPCPCSPCSPGQEQELQGCSPCFWRAPHHGSWDICLLLEPGQTALGKASPLPWECPARRNSSLTSPAPLFPWALLLHCVPSAVGMGHEDRALPAALSQPLLGCSQPSAQGTFPRTSTGIPCQRGSPKAGPARADLSLGFLTDDADEPSWGSPADKGGRKRSLQASPGSDAVSPSRLLLPSLAAGSRQSRVSGGTGQGGSSCPILRAAVALARAG